MQVYQQRHIDDRPQDDSSSERHSKRQKVRLACRECRDRKTRCDGGRPICESCIRKKLPADRCVYSVNEDYSESVYVASLKSRVQELESLLSQSTAPTLLNNINSTHPYEPRALASARAYTSSLNGRLSSAQTQTIQGTSSPTNADFQYQPSDALPPAGPAPIWPPEVVRPSARQEAASPITARHVGTSPRIIEFQRHDVVISQTNDEQDLESDDGPEENLSFLGSSSAVGFMTEVRQTLKRSSVSRSHRGQSDAFPSGETRLKSSWFGNSEHEYQPLNLSSPNFVIPPRHAADILLNNYWAGAHPLQPFIHRQSFMKRYELLWSSPPAAAGSWNGRSNRTLQSDQLFHCKLNLAFALGCRFRSLSIQQSDPHLDKSQQTFASRATELLNLELMDVATIDLVQALLLMAQYLQTKNLSDRCWVVVGMAIRVAQGIALHLDVAGESQAQREERRKTWCSCILLDRVLSMTFGRPLMLDSPSLGPLPQMVDDEYLTSDLRVADCSQPDDTPARIAYFVSVFNLSNITAEILRHIYSLTASRPSNNDLQTEDYNLLLRLDSELLSWQGKLPLHLHYNRAADTSDPNDLFTRQSHLLHHRFLNSRILLFRRVLIQVAAGHFSKASRTDATTPTLEQTLWRTCVTICTSSAQNLLDILESNIGTWLVPPAWFTVFLIYTAGTVLGVIFLTPALSAVMIEAPGQRESLQRSWNKCMECLTEYRRLGAPAAARCLSNLRKMHVDDSDEGQGASHGLPNEIFLSSENNGAMADGEGRSQHRSPTVARPSETTVQGDCGSAGEFENEHEAFDKFTLPDLWWPSDTIDWLVEMAEQN